MAKTKFFAFANSVWHADDYLYGCNCNPRYVERSLLASFEEVQAMSAETSADFDIYNDGWYYEAELDEETILEITDYETIEEFNEHWNGDGLRTDAENSIIDYICENYNGDPIDCNNYDFDKSIDGSIVIVWSWHRYVGYARKCAEIRYAYLNETERNLTKEDKSFVNQMDVVMTKEEVEASKNLKEDLFEKLLSNRDYWKWTNPEFVEEQIEWLTD